MRLIKITLFFCAGAIIYKTHREYVYQLDGFGRAMPVTMAGVHHRFVRIDGHTSFGRVCQQVGHCHRRGGNRNALAYAGVAALIVSALLTALYLMAWSFCVPTSPQKALIPLRSKRWRIRIV